MHRISLIIHPDDTVATLLDARAELTTHGSGLPVAPGIPFGHKTALVTMHEGEPVLKYGVVIGRATSDIAPGEHVHVHNLR